MLPHLTSQNRLISSEICKTVVYHKKREGSWMLRALPADTPTVLDTIKTQI